VFFGGLGINKNVQVIYLSFLALQKKYNFSENNDCFGAKSSKILNEKQLLQPKLQAFVEMVFLMSG
jgi:hypothetical protein